MDKFSVSVIMPTYNQCDYILNSIESVLNQSFSIYELIIVDNYSDDGTKDIIKGLSDSRIKYHEFNNHGVIASSRNYGVKKSRGNIVAFIDSDDIWVEKKIEMQLKHIQVDQVNLVSCNFYPLGNVLACRNHLHFNSDCEYKDFSYSDIVESNQVITSGVLLKKEIFEAALGFDENIEFRYIEDWELWLRIVEDGVVRVLKDDLVGYRINYNLNRDYRDVAFRTKNIINKNYRMHKFGRLRNIQLLANCDVNIGKACLECNDYKGIAHYIHGFVFSTNFTYRLRSAQGIMLFLMPRLVRKKVIQWISWMYNIYYQETR